MSSRDAVSVPRAARPIVRDSYDCRDAGGRVTHGAVTEKMETLRIDDVHEFCGHIVCDPESMPDVVVPLSLHGQPVGVLDIAK